MKDPDLILFFDKYPLFYLKPSNPDVDKDFILKLFEAVNDTDITDPSVIRKYINEMTAYYFLTKNSEKLNWIHDLLKSIKVKNSWLIVYKLDMFFFYDLLNNPKRINTNIAHKMAKSFLIFDENANYKVDAISSSNHMLFESNIDADQIQLNIALESGTWSTDFINTDQADG